MSTHAVTRKHRGVTTIVAVAALSAAAGGAAQADARPGSTGAKMVRSEAQLATATETLASPRSASPAGGHALGGFNVQGWPVVVEVSGNTKRIQLALTGLNMSCSSGARFPVQEFWQRLAVARNGRIHVARTIPATSGSDVSITGGSHSFAAVMNRRQATIFGAWRLHLDFRTADGKADHCDSGLVGFAARL
jgi:hypothetical protein